MTAEYRKVLLERARKLAMYGDNAQEWAERYANNCNHVKAAQYQKKADLSYSKMRLVLNKVK